MQEDKTPTCDLQLGLAAAGAHIKADCASVLRGHLHKRGQVRLVAGSAHQAIWGGGPPRQPAHLV